MHMCVYMYVCKCLFSVLCTCVYIYVCLYLCVCMCVCVSVCFILAVYCSMRVSLQELVHLIGSHTTEGKVFLSSTNFCLYINLQGEVGLQKPF